MDYIETELLRQRAVLARLLLGVPAEVGAEEGVPSSRRQAADAVLEGTVSGEALPGGIRAAAASGAAFFPGGEVSGGDGTLWDVPTEGGYRALAGQRTAETRLMAMSLEAAGQDSSAAGRGRAAADRGQATPPVGYDFGGDAGRSALLTVLPGRDTPAGEQASARTVSLWAERDARRYDGGYTAFS